MRQPRRRTSPALRRQLETDLFRQASRLAAATRSHVVVFTSTLDGETRSYGCPSPQDVIQRYFVVVDSVSAQRRRQPNEEEATSAAAMDEEERMDLERELEILNDMRARIERRMTELTGDGGAPPAGTTSSSS